MTLRGPCNDGVARKRTQYWSLLLCDSAQFIPSELNLVYDNDRYNFTY